MLIAFGCFSLTFGDKFLFFFSFPFAFIGLVSAVSSLALFILAVCIAWLPASLSFLFFRGYALYFFVPFLFFRRRCLSPVVFLQCFPGFVCYFLFLCDLLVIVSSVFSRSISFLCFREFAVRLSCILLRSFGAFPVLLEFRPSSSASA